MTNSPETTTTTPELTTFQKAEPFVIDFIAIGSLIAPINLAPPEALWVPLFILVLFYGLYNTNAPKYQVLQFFYGLSCIGVMFASMGVGYLLTGNILGSLLGLMVFFPFLMMKGVGSKNNPFAKLYEHPSRILLIPILFSLFANATEEILTLKLQPEMAGLVLLLAFLPVRFLITYDRPQKFYHIIEMCVALWFYMHAISTTILYSPTTAAWRIIDRQENGEDFLTVLDRTENEVVVEAHVASVYARRDINGSEIRGGSYYVVTSKTEKGWGIDIEKTKSYYENNKLDMKDFEYVAFRATGNRGM